ncbi:MAG: bifunctional phosphopantothenoylcysteine decarboxylase/phosphopantothenate--cysteine ligase CoaBC [Gammaproteobacteria bacterium]|nr:bifunctional phosphopantothenoylcysteine decarboxylase/phosphopantothenate--cysteine ligase CoaBC [Gammaproteobacteria bacterium]
MSSNHTTVNHLNNRRILLAVSGGIAAYKIPELVRQLIKSGAEVRVIMTHSACQFVTPLTLQIVSEHPVYADLFELEQAATETPGSQMSHIELARWADLILVAPATANTIAKISQGMADDLLSTTLLASSAPLMVAPAMNSQMWESDATQDNITLLTQRGITIVGPASGELACGEVGAGRLVEPSELLKALNDHFAIGPLSGIKVTITAGPTREPIDPVRYITNRSSGKMGYALATAARRLGADVRLVSGPVSMAQPPGINLIPVETAQEMLSSVMVDPGEIFIACAAVADYHLADVAEEKMKRSDSSLTLKLEPNPDILKSVAQLPSPPFTVGFAAETERLEEYALRKMEQKGIDMIAANLVGDVDSGFDHDHNRLSVYWRKGATQLDLASKSEIAEQLMALVIKQFSKQ